MEIISLQQFRDIDETELEFSPGLVYHNECWLSADSTGTIFQLKGGNGTGTFEATNSDGVTEGVPISCIAASPSDTNSDSIMISFNDSMSLRKFSDPCDSIEDGLGRRTLAISHMEYHPEGNHVVTSSAEEGLAILSLESKVNDRVLPTDQTGIRTFNQSCTGKYVCAVSMKGDILLYSLDYTRNILKGSKTCSSHNFEEKKGKIVSTAVVTGLGCKISWYPTEERLVVAVPHGCGTIMLLYKDGDKWKEDYIITDEPESEKRDICMVKFSPNGKYLLSVDVSQRVQIWSFDINKLDSARVIRTFNVSAEEDKNDSICDVAWGKLPSDNYVMLLSKNSWAKMDAAVQGALPAEMEKAVDIVLQTTLPNEAVAVNDADADEDADLFGDSPIKVMNANIDDNNNNNDDDDDDDDDSAWMALADDVEAEATKRGTDSSQADPTEMSAIELLDVTSSPDKTAPTSAVKGGRKRLVQKNRVTFSEGDDDEDALVMTQDIDLAAVASTSNTGAAVSTASISNSSSSSASDQVQPIAVNASKNTTKGDDDDDDDVFATDIEDIKRTTSPGLKVGQSMGNDDEDLEDEEEDENFIENFRTTSDDYEVPYQSIGAADTTFPGGLVIPQIPLQPPFQPSSSKPDEKKRRYLVWNNVGNITSREESVENRIEIRFTNTGGSNKNEAFPDRSGFTMAALSYEGAFFATDAEDDESPPRGSTLFYHAFSGQRHMEGVNNSFQYVLAAGESAVAIAVGQGWAAVATSKKFLRVFSSTGEQTAIISLDGPVVCMSGCESRLAIVYHAGLPWDDCQNENIEMHEINWRSGSKPTGLFDKVKVPMSPNALFSWIGFDCDTRSLLMIDSEGIVSTLLQRKSSGPVWVPLLDISKVRKSIEHNYWPVMVRDSKLVYVSLNGESKPNIYPQPVVSVQKFMLPIVSTKDGKEMSKDVRDRVNQMLFLKDRGMDLEARQMQLSARLTNEPSSAADVNDDLDRTEKALETIQKEADKAVLKVFQEACQLGQDGVALGLIRQLRTLEGMDFGIKIANHHGRASVAQQLDRVQEEMKTQIEEAEQLRLGNVGVGMQYEDDEDGVYDVHDDDGYNIDSEPQPEERSSVSKQLALPLHPSTKINNRQSKQEIAVGNPFKNMLKNSLSGPPNRSVVSPAAHLADNSAAAAINPFAVKKSGLTPMKRKDVFADVQELQGSPSPSKKLSRKTSFAQAARVQKNKDKTIL